MKQKFEAKVLEPDGEEKFEILWLEVENIVFAVSYFPPDAENENDFIHHINKTHAEILSRNPMQPIVLAGDVNKLKTENILNETTFTQIFNQPTRGNAQLDFVLTTQELFDKTEL